MSIRSLEYLFDPKSVAIIGAAQNRRFDFDIQSKPGEEGMLLQLNLL
jgi:hypothetical protein